MIKMFLALALGGLLFSCQSKQTSSEENTATTTKTNSTIGAGSGAQVAFNELHRPQFHFTPPGGWMNDPNGMVYHNGEYHLFYQHNPDSTVWGPMHWGHAVSKDLVRWEHLPIALFPDSLGTIFSGSAVVDTKNTSGLGTKEKPAMVAIFTYHNAEGEKAGRNDFQTQGLAYSLDNGRNWTKYKANPVLKNPGIRDFRDPKVFWYEKEQKWVMTLAVMDHITFYSSKNLLNWIKESDFGLGIGGHGGVWECPDLFPLKIKGTNQEKWVLIVNINPGAPNGGSGTQYFVGHFDGKNFVLDTAFKKELAGRKNQGIWLDYGKDNYAGVTWSNVPESDGRRLFMGWMSNWQYANVVPTEKWRSATTVARTLTLENTPAGLRVVSNPVQELKNIYGQTHQLPDTSTTSILNLPNNTATFEADLTIQTEGQPGNFAVELSNSINQRIVIGYDALSKRYFIDRTQAGPSEFSKDFAGVHYAPRIATGTTFPIKLVVDVASVEVFADGGKTVMTEIFFPEEKFTQIRIFSNRNKVKLTNSRITELKSIWQVVQ